MPKCQSDSWYENTVPPDRTKITYYAMIAIQYWFISNYQSINCGIRIKTGKLAYSVNTVIHRHLGILGMAYCGVKPFDYHTMSSVPMELSK